MVDAWTQTSNDGWNKDESKAEDDESSVITHQFMKSTSNIPQIEDNKLQTYKNNESNYRMRVRVNSTIKQNKTFRSPEFKQTNINNPNRKISIAKMADLNQ